MFSKEDTKSSANDMECTITFGYTFKSSHFDAALQQDSRPTVAIVRHDAKNNNNNNQKKSERNKPAVRRSERDEG